MKSSRLYTISLLLLLSTFSVLAQEEEGSLEIEEYNVEETVEEDAVPRVNESELSQSERSSYLNADTDYKDRYKGDAYTYIEKEEKPIEKSEPIDIKKPSAPTMSGGWIGIALKILLGIVALIGIIFLVQALSNSGIAGVKRTKKENEVNRKVSTTTRDLEAPEELDETNLQLMLKNALSAGDHYAAVRYYFLIYLEKLERSKAIVYHQDKTNADYLTELGNTPESDSFTQLSYVYEYLWYGRKVIDAQGFEQVETLFQQAIKK